MIKVSTAKICQLFLRVEQETHNSSKKTTRVLIFDFTGFAGVVEITWLNTGEFLYYYLDRNCAVMNLNSYSVLSPQTTLT